MSVPQDCDIGHTVLRHDTPAVCPRCGGRLDRKATCHECNWSAGLRSRGGQRWHIGLYGITQSGKTVFLASLIDRLLALSQEKVAVELSGWRPSVPAKAVREQANVCRMLVSGGPTHATLKDEYRPLEFSFRRTRLLLGEESYTLDTHDLSGEVVCDWIDGRPISRVMLASLSVDVARSAGLILLVDPTHEIRDGPFEGFQDSLWRSLIDGLLEEGEDRPYDKPVALVLTKCDLPDVAEAVGMPSFDARTKAENDPEEYSRLVQEQDKSALRFVRHHMPKIWTAINPDDPHRTVTKCRVIALSSMGVSGKDLSQEGKLRPWRVSEPVVWILDAIARQKKGHIWLASVFLATVAITLIVLTRVLGAYEPWGVGVAFLLGVGAAAAHLFLQSRRRP